MRIGIIGSGRIVQELLDEIKDEKSIEVVSLLGRAKSIDKLNDIKSKYAIEKIETDPEIFLQDDDFDTVYIGLVNSLHYIYAKKALEAGKNVICEKPFTMTHAECLDLINIAKEKHLFLFEAMTSRYSHNYHLVQEALDKVGNISLIQCNLSQYSSRYDRYLAGEITPAFDPEKGGGALYDLNVYCLRFVAGLLGQPKDVHYFPNKGFNGIDVSGVCILDYGNAKAICIAAKDSSSPNYAYIQGDKGRIEVRSNPSRPNDIYFIDNDGNETKLSNEFEEGHLIYEFLGINLIIEEDDYDTCLAYLEETSILMKVLDAAKANS